MAWKSLVAKGDIVITPRTNESAGAFALSRRTLSGMGDVLMTAYRVWVSRAQLRRAVIAAFAIASLCLATLILANGPSVAEDATGAKTQTTAAPAPANGTSTDSDAAKAQSNAQTATPAPAPNPAPVPNSAKDSAKPKDNSAANPAPAPNSATDSAKPNDAQPPIPLRFPDRSSRTTIQPPNRSRLRLRRLPSPAGPIMMQGQNPITTRGRLYRRAFCRGSFRPGACSLPPMWS